MVLFVKVKARVDLCFHGCDNNIMISKLEDCQLFG